MSDSQIEKHKAQLTALIHALKIIYGVNVPAMLKGIEIAEGVGPMLDPTLYRANSEKMGQDKEMLKALLPAWEYAQGLDKHAKENT
jgi:hypothetical protein